MLGTHPWSSADLAPRAALPSARNNATQRMEWLATAGTLQTPVGLKERHMAEHPKARCGKKYKQLTQKSDSEQPLSLRLFMEGDSYPISHREAII